MSNSTSAMVFVYSFYDLYLIIENVSLAIQCFILIALDCVYQRRHYTITKFKSLLSYS